jgi:RNA polymerase sigma factor (sigma-70 family)
LTEKTARDGERVERDSDNDIMVRVRDGHPEELGVLFERHHVRLLNFFMRMTGNRSMSEDMVQDSFIRMLRYRETFRGEGGGFTTWMYTLARSVCIDRLRRESRRIHADIDDVDPAGGGLSPLEEIEKEQSSRLLQQCLLRLSEEKREVLILHRFHFKKFREIAEILDCSVSTAKTRAHRAIIELRQIYAGLQREEAR